MSRGRKPKPTELKRVQGNPGKRPLPKNEPRPTKPVKKPRGMNRGAKKFWDEYAPEIERLGILTGVDVSAFRLLSEHYVLSIWAVRELHEGGLIVEGVNGPKKNPVATIFKENSRMALRYMSEFGMTPSSRSRLEVPPDADQMDIFEQISQLMDEAAARSDLVTGPAELEDFPEIE